MDSKEKETSRLVDGVGEPGMMCSRGVKVGGVFEVRIA